MTTPKRPNEAAHPFAFRTEHYDRLLPPDFDDVGPQMNLEALADELANLASHEDQDDGR